MLELRQSWSARARKMGVDADEVRRWRCEEPTVSIFEAEDIIDTSGLLSLLDWHRLTGILIELQADPEKSEPTASPASNGEHDDTNNHAGPSMAR